MLLISYMLGIKVNLFCFTDATHRIEHILTAVGTLETKRIFFLICLSAFIICLSAFIFCFVTFITYLDAFIICIGAFTTCRITIIISFPAIIFWLDAIIISPDAIIFLTIALSFEKTKLYH